MSRLPRRPPTVGASRTTTRSTVPDLERVALPQDLDRVERAWMAVRPSTS